MQEVLKFIRKRLYLSVIGKKEIPVEEGGGADINQRDVTQGVPRNMSVARLLEGCL